MNFAKSTGGSARGCRRRRRGRIGSPPVNVGDVSDFASARLARLPSASAYGDADIVPSSLSPPSPSPSPTRTNAAGTPLIPWSNHSISILRFLSVSHIPILTMKLLFLLSILYIQRPILMKLV